MDCGIWKHVVRGGGLHVNCRRLPAGNDAHLPQEDVDASNTQEDKPGHFWIEWEGEEAKPE